MYRVANSDLVETHVADARKLPVGDNTVDLIVTSPPYWRKRDYGSCRQIGQESTLRGYILAMARVLREAGRVLRPTGSVFLNIGDTYVGRSLVGVPGLLEDAARRQGWLLRNRIVWAKPRGVPSPARNRLPNRHEYVLHLVRHPNYYYDFLGYIGQFHGAVDPGDVWDFPTSRVSGTHLAPFPAELARRAILLACPAQVCEACGAPRRRIARRARALDPRRPQARRALELAKAAGLREEHFAAIRATGISDAGKGARAQAITGGNSAHVQALAIEAKQALRGYFREFTFGPLETEGWTGCACDVNTQPGVVLDCFAGTGTTLWTAEMLGRRAIGIDLHPILRPLARAVRACK